MKATATLLVLVLACSSVASAQTTSLDRDEISRYERFLLPVVLFDELNGAYGSVWMTEIALRNSSGEAIEFHPHSCGALSVACPRFGLLRPYETLTQPPILYSAYGSWAKGGLFLFLEKPASRISLSLHLREVGRGVGWETLLPVVNENESFTERVEILNVPTNSNFRHTLRVYGFDNRNPSSYRLRFYDLAVPFYEVSSRAALHETTVTASAVEYRDDFPLRPGYAQLDLAVQNVAALAAVEKLRITIEPLQEGRFWTYLTLADNATQQVTLFVPEK